MSDSDRSSLRGPRDVGVAYLLWACTLLGIAGLNRFYTGHWRSGLLYLFTLGICGVGSFLDLFLIPDQVRSFNESNARPQTLIPPMGRGLRSPQPRQTSLEWSILELARKHGERGFTLNDAVVELQLPLREIERELERLQNPPLLLLTVENDETGRTVYREPGRQRPKSLRQRILEFARARGDQGFTLSDAATQLKFPAEEILPELENFVNNKRPLLEKDEWEGKQTIYREL